MSRTRVHHRSSSHSESRAYIIFDPRTGDLSSELSKITGETTTVHITRPFTVMLLQRILRRGPNIQTLSLPPFVLGQLSAQVQIFCKNNNLSITVGLERNYPQARGSLRQTTQAALERNAHVLGEVQKREQKTKEEATKQTAQQRKYHQLVQKFGASLAVLEKLPEDQFDIYKMLLTAIRNGTFSNLRVSDQRAAKVLALRFGLQDSVYRTLEQVGQLMDGLTRERIRQIETRGLRTLRASS